MKRSFCKRFKVLVERTWWLTQHQVDLNHILAKVFKGSARRQLIYHLLVHLTEKISNSTVTFIKICKRLRNKVDQNRLSNFHSVHLSKVQWLNKESISNLATLQISLLQLFLTCKERVPMKNSSLFVCFPWRWKTKSIQKSLN